MTNVLVDDVSLTAIGNAIRAKNGTTTTYKPAQMADAISAITTGIGDELKNSGISKNIKTKAIEVANKVKAVLKDESIVFITMADAHYCGEENSGWKDNSNLSMKDAAKAAKILSYALPLDFMAYLGDFAFGTVNSTEELLKASIEVPSAWLDEFFSDYPEFRAVGNHDTGTYSTLLGASYLYSKIGSRCEDATYGSTTYGYCYRDFESKKFRVICLNTCEGETDSGSNASYILSNTQLKWFADTLYSAGSKTDASQWGVIILGHYPLDYAGCMTAGNVLGAYVNGTSITIGSDTVNFNGHNGAKIYGNFHGHSHCFKVDNLHIINNGTATAYDSKRIATPAINYYKSNDYSTLLFNGIDFGEATTYNKTADNDTAFTVNIINPSDKLIYSYCFGAGYDRTVSIDFSKWAVTNTLSHVSTSNTGITVSNEEAFTTTLSADSGYNMGAVKVTMGGVDITSSTYDSSTGVVSIASVTGNINITANGVKIVNYTNVVTTSQNADGTIYNSTGYKDGYRINSTGEEAALNNYVCTGFIPWGNKQHTLRIGGDNVTFDSYGCMISMYNSNHAFLTGYAYSSVGSNSDYGTVTQENTTALTWLSPTTPNATTNAAYIRVSAKGAGANLIVTLDQTIE